MALVDVLIPTFRRKTGLAVVLTSLLGQEFTDFDVIISDQTDEDASYLESIEIQSLVRALRWHGHHVALHRHLPRRGMAEQRNFLLSQSRAPYVHYLDDVRPDQERIEPWEGPVRPEPFTPETLPWDRHKVNNAANPLHLEGKLAPDGRTIRYRVAWVGGANVLFDRTKLLSVGGFSWWWRLPSEHAGEEVVVQFLLIRKYGGCGILPCGTYHLGLPTSVTDREHNATEHFRELIEEYDLDPVPWDAGTDARASCNV